MAVVWSISGKGLEGVGGESIQYDDDGGAGNRDDGGHDDDNQVLKFLPVREKGRRSWCKAPLRSTLMI